MDNKKSLEKEEGQKFPDHSLKKVQLLTENVAFTKLVNLQKETIW